MTDENGNRINPLDSQIFLRFARVIFPFVLTIISSLGLYVLNDLTSKIAEVRAAADARGQALWSVIQKLQDDSKGTHESLQVLIAKTTDNAENFSHSFNSLQDRVIDHETRIRVLERPSPH